MCGEIAALCYRFIGPRESRPGGGDIIQQPDIPDDLGRLRDLWWKMEPGGILALPIGSSETEVPVAELRCEAEYLRATADMIVQAAGVLGLVDELEHVAELRLKAGSLESTIWHASMPYADPALRPLLPLGIGPPRLRRVPLMHGRGAGGLVVRGAS